MPSVTAIYLDFQDTYSYRAWQWLRLLPELRDVEMRPYSMDAEEGRRVSPWDRTRPSVGLELLALAEVARDVGPECLRLLVDAVFRALHVERWDLSRPEAWLALAAEAGLDLQVFTDDSERWRAEVGLWHQEAEDELGVTGVPTLVVDGGQALLVKLEKHVTEVAEARRLLRDVLDVVHPPVQEVRRTG